MIDPNESGSLFHSDGALYLNAKRPISLDILGVRKNRVIVCLSLYCEINGIKIASDEEN